MSEAGQADASAAAEVKKSKAEELAEKIAAKEAQLAKLKAEKRRIEAKAKSRVSKEARKADARRKILIGSMVLEAAEKSGALNDLKAKLDAYLKRDNDRALFELQPSSPQA